MLQNLLQNISGNPKAMAFLKIIGWTIIIVALIFTNIIMKNQEISFVYTNF